jgi:hypothetical protein
MFVFVILFSPLPSVATIQTQQQQQQQKIFEDPVLGFSIQYPQNWNIRSEAPSIVLLIANGTTNVVVNIHVKGYNPPFKSTIYEQLEHLTTNAKGDANFSLINSTILNPPQVYQPAVKIMGYNLGYDTTYKQMSVWMFDDNTAKIFFIRYTAAPDTFATFLPAVNEMIKSFRPVQVR